MNSYARSFDLCGNGKDKDDLAWVPCDALAKGDSLRIETGDLLKFAKKENEDGSTSYGYAFVTSNRKYAGKLTKELKRLGFVESERLSDGGVLFKNPEYPSIKLLRWETPTLASKLEPVWVFAVKREVL